MLFWKSPSVLGWYSSDPNTSILYRCYSFSLLRSEAWKEMLLSLFTLRLGLIMTLSSWFVLLATTQIIIGKPFWNVWLEFVVVVSKVFMKLTVALVSYEFIIMKFPQYIMEVVTAELCTVLPMTPNEDIANAVGVLVTLCAVFYLIQSIYFARNQNELMCKATSYDIAIRHMGLDSENKPAKSCPLGYKFIEAINNKMTRISGSKSLC